MKKRSLIAHAIFFFALVALPWSAFAQSNYGLQFDGSTNSLDLGSDVASGVRSIELWFKPSVDITPIMPMGGVALLVRNDDLQTNEFGLHFRGSEWPDGRGYLYFFMRDNGVLHEIVSNSNAWATNAWHHVCGTIDPVEGMKLYVDGVLQNDTEPTGTMAIPTSSETTTIGTWGEAQIRYFPGTIDEVRMWDRSLDAAEVLANMCLSLEPPVDGLIGYWPLDEGNGSTALDATTGAHDGAINGATYVLVSNCLSASITPVKPVSTGLALIPNPCAEVCALSLDNAVQQATLTITDALGRVVLRQQGLSGSRFHLAAHDLPAGRYVVQLTDGIGGTSQRAALIVACGH